MIRVLLSGLCLIAIHSACGFAQTLPDGSDNPVKNRPAAVDGSVPTPGTIPEIIRQPDGSDNLPKARAIADPGSVLTPPTVNLQFLRSIRLDWDHMGGGADLAHR